MSYSFTTIDMVHSLFRYAIKTLFLFILLCTSTISFSAVVDGLFHSNIEVISQQASDRQEAFNQALLKTLLKVSGHRDLVFSPGTRNDFFPAEKYVQSFSYKENPRYTDFLEYKKQISIQEQSLSTTQSLNSINNVEPIVILNAENSVDPEPVVILDAENSFDPEPLPYLLDVNFSSRALEAQMKKSNLPVWGNVRPEIMFWVLMESEGVRELVGSTKPTIFNDQLLKLSKDYALPVAIPLSDELDLSAINMSDLWGLFPDAIDQAKQRYASNGNLMVRIYQSHSNTWSANWHFSINGVSYTGQLHNSSVSVITDEIMNFLSLILSKRFSIATSDITAMQDITLEVININHFKDYVDIQTFLEDLAPIKSYSLEWLEGSVMSFSLKLNGTPEKLQEYLGLSGKLQFISSSTNEILSDPVVIEENPFDDKQNASDLVEQVVTKPFVRIEKYKWLGSSPETIKK